MVKPYWILIITSPFTVKPVADTDYLDGKAVYMSCTLNFPMNVGEYNNKNQLATVRLD